MTGLSGEERKVSISFPIRLRPIAKTMRSASFFFLSVSLHAAVLAYPVTFARPTPGEAIRVIILPMESESVGHGDTRASSSPAPRGETGTQFKPRPAASARVEAKPAHSAEPQIIADAEVETVSESRVSLVWAPSAQFDGETGETSGATTGVGGDGAGTGGIGTGSNGYAVDRPGPGGGSSNGAGSASGSSASGTALTQARYRETPRPNYPDNARREGREGRVLLRVLVDDQGRSKQVEINSSSGSPLLDQAAAEAIKRWRFHPARHGDQPVASWLRIPIEFHLEDRKH